MTALPDFMFEPIEPRLTAWEQFRELWTIGRAAIMARKENIKALNAARAKSMTAFKAYKSVQKLRDGTATIKRHKLTQCVTDQLRAENACRAQ